MTSTETSPNQSVEERIAAIYSPIWIGYPKAIAIRERIEGLMNHPKSHRMPNLAIIGDSNNGKSMILQNVLKRNTPPFDPNTKKTTLPVFLIQTPPEPNESRLYRVILEALFADAERREPPESMIGRIKLLLTALETRLLVLDEFNNALAGSLLRQKRFLNALRFIGNELQISIAVAGTVEAQRALSSDPQLANRFEPVFLPRWTEGEDFLRMLKSFEQFLGLKEASNLHSLKAAKLILMASEGLIGDALTLLRRLAVRAIKSGSERIEHEWLKKNALDEFGWVAPSYRTRSPL